MARKGNIVLNNAEIKALENLARVSKMDCWFGIDQQGRIRDYENHSRVLSQRKGIKQLIDGATNKDLERIGSGDRASIIHLLFKLI